MLCPETPLVHSYTYALTLSRSPFCLPKPSGVKPWHTVQEQRVLTIRPYPSCSVQQQQSAWGTCCVQHSGTEAQWDAAGRIRLGPKKSLGRRGLHKSRAASWAGKNKGKNNSEVYVYIFWSWCMISLSLSPIELWISAAHTANEKNRSLRLISSSLFFWGKVNIGLYYSGSFSGLFFKKKNVAHNEVHQMCWDRPALILEARPACSPPAQRKALLLVCWKSFCHLQMHVHTWHFFMGTHIVCIFCYFIFSLTIYHEHISMPVHVRILPSFLRLPGGPRQFWVHFLTFIHGNNEAINVHLSVIRVNLIWEKNVEMKVSSAI